MCSAFVFVLNLPVIRMFRGHFEFAAIISPMRRADNSEQNRSGT